MACTCEHEAPPAAAQSPRYRRILWAALILNAAMFVVELAGSHQAGSLSLLADAIDFAGDAINYGVSLAVLGAALAWRARAAWVKAWTMMGFGAFVLGRALWSVWHGAVPEPLTMGLIGTLALLVNVGVAALLYTYREGDANMRSVWLCSRNDAIGNLAVMGAALGVAGTRTAWPDLAVAALMAALALQGGLAVRRQARAELAAGGGGGRGWGGGGGPAGAGRTGRRAGGSPRRVQQRRGRAPALKRKATPQGVRGRWAWPKGRPKAPPARRKAQP